MKNVSCGAKSNIAPHSPINIISSLTGIQLIAALMVFMSHYMALMLITALSVNQNTLASRFLSHHAVAVLGESSCAFYLFHMLLVPLYKGFHGNLVVDSFAYIFSLGVAIMIAFGLHKLVELPAKRMIVGIYNDKYPKHRSNFMPDARKNSH